MLRCCCCFALPHAVMQIVPCSRAMIKGTLKDAIEAPVPIFELVGQGKQARDSRARGLD